MLVAMGNIKNKLAKVDFDTMSVSETPYDEPYQLGEKFEDLFISEDADPTLLTDAYEPFVLVMYDEKSAEAEGFLIAPTNQRQRLGFDIEDVTPGGAVRVAVAWAREQDVRYVLRYLNGRKELDTVLKLYDVTDFK